MTCTYFERLERYNVVINLKPSLAAAWLNDCNTHNRKLIDAHVDRLAREMKSGRWRLTHQGIAFSTNRVLLDGQHRLWAVVLSETTVPMRVFFNEPAEALGCVDSIRPRTNDELISLASGMGPVTKGELATLRAMIMGLNAYNRMTAGEEAELLAQYRPAVDFAHEVLPSARYRGIASAVTRGVLARAWYSAPRQQLRHFADVLQTGIASSEQDQPVTQLFRFLIDAAHGRHGRPEARERYGKTQRALTAYLAGDSLGRLFAATSELFPLPNEQTNQVAA